MAVVAPELASDAERDDGEADEEDDEEEDDEDDEDTDESSVSADATPAPARIAIPAPKASAIPPRGPTYRAERIASSAGRKTSGRKTRCSPETLRR